jgi:hypothetical protein
MASLRPGMPASVVDGFPETSWRANVPAEDDRLGLPSAPCLALGCKGLHCNSQVQSSPRSPQQQPAAAARSSP